jgi:hypothetical protein
MKDIINSLSPLDHALELADTYDWSVFPVLVKPKPDGKTEKIALVNWATEASNNPEIIEAMVTSKKGVPAWDHATHVGVSCEPSGVWVVDEDKAEAAKSLNLPETLIMKSRRGRHFIYQNAAFDQRNTQSNPVPDVDIRANGGMFVCYGQVIHDAEIAPWPFDYVISSKSSDTGGNAPNIATVGVYKGIDDYKQLFLAAITDGQKHAATRDLAASLATQGVKYEFAAGLIMAVCPVNDDNLMKSIQSAYDKYSSPDYRHANFDLVRDQKQRPIWNTANAEVLLTQHPDWKGVLGFNELTGRRMILNAIPGTPGGDRQLEDDDYTAATGWFNRNGFPNARDTITGPAIRRACRANTFNPLTDYLDGLTWDGTKRAETWLIEFGGAEDTKFNREAGLRWLISAVARAFSPGVKVDHMLVLEGAQGSGKSSGIRALAGDGDMFGDNLPDMTHKDAQEYVRGKWIIEVAELVAARRDINAVKAFISRQTDEFRWSYGREVVQQPRRCAFIGTTNDDAYLRDETGNRRFWPVKIQKMDVEWIANDRDQLWAEAVELYRSGLPWWLSPDLETMAQEAQAERLDVDPWQSDVAAYVVDKDMLAPRQVIAEVLGKVPADISRRDSDRVCGILRTLGFERDGKITSGAFKDAPKYVRKASSCGGQ